MLLIIFAVLAHLITIRSSLELLRSRIPVVLNLRRPSLRNHSSSFFDRVSVGRDHDDIVTSPRLFEKILDISPNTPLHISPRKWMALRRCGLFYNLTADVLPSESGLHLSVQGTELPSLTVAPDMTVSTNKDKSVSISGGVRIEERNMFGMAQQLRMQVYKSNEGLKRLDAEPSIGITWSDCVIGDESVGIECKYSRDVIDRGGKARVGVEPRTSEAVPADTDEGTLLSVVGSEPTVPAFEDKTEVSHIASARFVKRFYPRGAAVAVSSEPYAVVEGAERPRKAESRSGGNPPREESITSPVDQQSPRFRLFGAKHSLTMQDNTGRFKVVATTDHGLNYDSSPSPAPYTRSTLATSFQCLSVPVFRSGINSVSHEKAKERTSTVKEPVASRLTGRWFGAASREQTSSAFVRHGEVHGAAVTSTQTRWWYRRSASTRTLGAVNPVEGTSKIECGKIVATLGNQLSWVFGKGHVPKRHLVDVADASRDAVLFCKDWNLFPNQHQPMKSRALDSSSHSLSDQRTLDLQGIVEYVSRHSPLVPGIFGSVRVASSRHCDAPVHQLLSEAAAGLSCRIQGVKAAISIPWLWRSDRAWTTSGLGALKLSLSLCADKF